MLVCCDLQPFTLRLFWEELRADLRKMLHEDLTYVSDHDIRLLRGSIIAAARVAATGLVNQLEQISRRATNKGDQT